jgi:hypothetical protein
MLDGLGQRYHVTPWSLTRDGWVALAFNATCASEADRLEDQEKADVGKADWEQMKAHHGIAEERHRKWLESRNGGVPVSG